MPEVFPFPHNWRVPYRARLGYRTDIGVSENDTEQRRAIRQIPTRLDSLLATALDDALPGWLDSLLFGGQVADWAVPAWPGAATLEAEASPGSNVVLQVPTTDRGFVAGGEAVLHLDPFTTELVTIAGLTGTTLTAAALVGTWPAQRTEVIPAHRARLSGDLLTSRPGHDAAELPLTFEGEPGPDPGVSIPGAPQIFSVVDPNSREPIADRLTRSVARHDSPSYRAVEYAQGATPIGSRERVLLSLTTRAEIAALQTWFHGLRGALTAFWWPTFLPDLVPIGAVAGTELTIAYRGYTARCFPHEARRHLGIVPPAGAVLHRRVVASVDNADGTETLTLDAAVAGPVSLVSFLLYVRAGDALELAWADQETAEATLTLTELPRQVPTSV